MAEIEEEKTIREENHEKEDGRKGNGGKRKLQGKKLSGRAKFWIVILIIFLISLPGYFLGLTVRKYKVRDERIQGNLRIALVTDLHSCKYGEGQSKLLSAIEEQHPDVILLGGDIFDDVLSDERTYEFLAGISGKYPCYYVTGNHECWAGGNAYRSKMETLKNYGITRLSGESTLLETGSGTVRLCGIDDPDIVLVQSQLNTNAELLNLKESISDKEFTILLAHRPELIDKYEQTGFDLVLAGHAHGGQVRIPGIMNGFYAPNQGLFPKYAGGRFEKNDMTMIVSRGLAKESTKFPRFCNPPELVIIDLAGTK
ncbi:MAG: metallophosphoesterase [Lachnospiraceae bacterium]|nr:metallophosphoesterase [Lachnospiraceae bacterium]